MIPIVQASGAKTHLVLSMVRNPDEPQTTHVETVCGREMDVTEGRPRIVLGETDSVDDGKDYCRVCIKNSGVTVSSTESDEPTEPTVTVDVGEPITADSLMDAIGNALIETYEEGLDPDDPEYDGDVTAMSETAMLASGMVKIIPGSSTIVLPSGKDDPRNVDVTWTSTSATAGPNNPQWIADTFELADTMVRQMYTGAERHRRIRHVRNSRRAGMKAYLRSNG